MTKRKELVLIRHAKSEAQNTHRVERLSSFAMVDAKLHETGFEKMEELGGLVVHDRRFDEMELILCSPMTRAIQTCCLVFKHSTCPIVLVPELAEFGITPRMTGYENRGRNCEQIKADPNLQALARFKDIDFSLVDDYSMKYGVDWWSKGYEPERSRAQIHRLKKFINELPQEKVAIVGHCCNFMTLLGTYRRVPNGTPIWATIVPSRSDPCGLRVVRQRRRSK